MSRYGIHAKIMAVPGKRDQLVGQLLKAAGIVGDAPGCEIYFVSVSPTELDAVLVTEVWASKDLHDASLLVPAVKSLIQETRPLIDKFGEFVITAPLGGKGLPSKELTEE
jgi:quinol monooxygenase YgiN